MKQIQIGSPPFETVIAAFGQVYAERQADRNKPKPREEMWSIEARALIRREERGCSFNCVCPTCQILTNALEGAYPS